MNDLIEYLYKYLFMDKYLMHIVILLDYRYRIEVV